MLFYPIVPLCVERWIEYRHLCSGEFGVYGLYHGHLHQTSVYRDEELDYHHIRHIFYNHTWMVIVSMDYTDYRFMWCIILSLTYTDNLVYNVRTTFIFRAGRLPTYWFAIICAFVASMVFDIAIITLRVTFFPKDADVFAELEKDPLIKARFEEEAASELQQSWNRGKHNNDDEIEALLDRPRNLEEGNASSKQWASPTKSRASDSDDENAGHGDLSGLNILDVQRRGSLTHTGMDEEIAQRFGAVIRKPFRRLPTSE